MGKPCLSVHELRSRWKPIKARLLEAHPDYPTAIRMHRTLSWLQRCEQATDGQDPDLVLICLWIGFNGLYGRWDQERREPLPDRACWRQFIDRLLKVDATGHLASMLTEQRDLLMSILDDEFLSSFFWEDPNEIRASKSKKAKFDARTWYIEKKWSLILDRLIERIYLLRCQLMHGAATFGGKLNRESLERCIEMMRCLLEAVLLVVIDHGAHEDLGAMCYPPSTVGKVRA